MLRVCQSRRSLVSALFLFVCAVVGAKTPFASAQPMAADVPANAVIYASWRGTDAAQAQYVGSHLESIMDQTTARQTMAALLGAVDRAVEATSADSPMRGLTADLDTVSSALLHRSMAFYVTLPSNEDGRAAPPHAALMIDAGPDAEEVESAAAQLITLLRQENPRSVPPINTRSEGGRVILSFGPAPAGSSSLDQSARFEQARSATPNAPIAMLYVDTARLIQFIVDAPHSELTPAMASSLGLDGLESLTVSGGFHGPRWRTEVFVHAPGRRTGLLSVMDGEPINNQTLRLVPRNATWLTAGRLDLAHVMDIVRGVAHEQEPQQGQQLEDALEMLSQFIGVDLEQQLIDALGPTWVAYNDPDVAGPMGMGGVLVNPLREPAQVDEALSRLEQMANALLLQQQQGGPMRWRMITRKHGDMTIHSAVLPVLSPSWAVHDGKLYVSLLPQGLITAAEGHDASVLDNPKFIETRKRLKPGAGLTSIGYIDLETTAPLTYPSYLSLTQTAPAAAIAFGGDAPVSLLPPLRKLRPHLSPVGGASWTDADGWHWRMDSPFPGSSALSRPALGGMLNSPIALQSTALTVGTMLPALGAARRTARQMQANTQARGIHQGMIIYAQSHDGNLADDPADLLADNLVTPDYLLAPTSGKSLPAGYTNWSEQRQHNWMRRSASYIIVPNLTEDLDPEKIAVFMRPGDGTDTGIAVAYNDNHVVWETDINAVRRKLREQTGMSMRQLIRRQESLAGDLKPQPAPSSR